MDVNSLKVIIVDDEAPAREELLHLIKSINDVEVTGTAKDGIEAENLLNTRDADVILLDIQMPGLSGIEVARKMVAKGTETLIIFTTAYDAFAIEAFEVHAVDYLLKPIRLEKLQTAFEIVRKRKRSSGKTVNKNSELEVFFENFINRQEPKQFISVFQGDQIIPIKISTILFAEARGRFVWLCTVDGEFKSNMNFREAEELLLPPRFFICHRSFIVNIDAIEAIDLWVNNSYRLKIKGTNTAIPVSRSHKEEFQKLMGI